MEYTKIQVVARSQYGITVAPMDAEAYEYPATIMKECFYLVYETSLPVTLIGKHGDKCIFPV